MAFAAEHSADADRNAVHGDGEGAKYWLRVLSEIKNRGIRTVICTTNAIESINSRLRRAVSARGHFPTEQAALRCLHLAIMNLDPTGRGRQPWTNRWKAAPRQDSRRCPIGWRCGGPL
jgi:transposase-like protein